MPGESWNSGFSVSTWYTDTPPGRTLPCFQITLITLSDFGSTGIRRSNEQTQNPSFSDAVTLGSPADVTKHTIHSSSRSLGDDSAAVQRGQSWQSSSGFRPPENTLAVEEDIKRLSAELRRDETSFPCENAMGCRDSRGAWGTNCPRGDSHSTTDTGGGLGGCGSTAEIRSFAGAEPMNKCKGCNKHLVRPRIDEQWLWLRCQAVSMLEQEALFLL